jgi:hypothetical protein
MQYAFTEALGELIVRCQGGLHAPHAQEQPPR